LFKDIAATRISSRPPKHREQARRKHGGPNARPRAYESRAWSLRRQPRQNRGASGESNDQIRVMPRKRFGLTRYLIGYRPEPPGESRDHGGGAMVLSGLERRRRIERTAGGDIGTRLSMKPNRSNECSRGESTATSITAVLSTNGSPTTTIQSLPGR
jgi:hypothetical protein